MDPRLYYTSFMLLALAAFLIARHYIPKPAALRRVPVLHRVLLALMAFVGGALGAKVPFALGATEGPFSPIAWMRDGKTVTTGIIGAYLAVEFTKLALGIRVKTGDTFALPLALALAVGRWGCFLNGCCYGVPTELPWGVRFGDGVCRHPTQVYEVAFHLSLALVLYLLLRHHLLRGQHLKLYL